MKARRVAVSHLLLALSAVPLAAAAWGHNLAVAELLIQRKSTRHLIGSRSEARWYEARATPPAYLLRLGASWRCRLSRAPEAAAFRSFWNDGHAAWLAAGQTTA